MSASVRTNGLPATCVAPWYTFTVLPVTVAVPLVAVMSKLTRKFGAEALVMPSVLETPVSDAATRASVGAAGGVVSSRAL